MACITPTPFSYNTDLSQIGIYNVLDESYDGSTACGMKTGNSALQNQVALQAAVDAATHNGGGTILIPTGTYQIQGPINIGHDTGSPPQSLSSLLIRGTSGNTTLQVTALGLDGGNLFEVNTKFGHGDDPGGTTFEDLTIQYVDISSGTAIEAGNKTFPTSPPTGGAENVRLFRILFLDCPQAVWFGDTLQATMTQCTIQYQNTSPSDAAILIGRSQTQANETHIADCVISNTVTSPPAVGSVGVQVQAAVELRMVNCTIQGFEQGIVITPGHELSKRLYFGDVYVSTFSSEASTGAAVLIQPSETAIVLQAEFVGCTFVPDTALGTTAYTQAGVNVVGSGTAPPLVDQVRFVSCYSCGWAGPGLAIHGATNVEVLGGFYSCNGTLDGTPSAQAGIFIGENSLNIRIVGAACNNSIYGASPTQQYGVSVVGSVAGSEPKNIFIRSCDLSGNLASALSVLDAVNVQATNNAGYNDQGGHLSTTLPSSGATISNLTYNYYGPISFYISSLSGLLIDSITVGLSSGGFTLSPGESATISYGGTPTYLVVGR